MHATGNLDNTQLYNHSCNGNALGHKNMVSNAFAGHVYASTTTQPKTGIDAQKFSRKNCGGPEDTQ